MINYKLIKIDQISYNDAFSLQKILQNKVLSNNNEQYIIALSHNDVITTGKRGFLDALRYDNKFYSDNNIELVKTDRGGLATFHGKGQLVIYFILNLINLKLGVKNFVNKIELALIKTLDFYNINAQKIEGIRGVFVGNNKIAAVGMHVKHNVTTHGIALNISTDLSKFELFTPCGLSDKGVTSMEVESKTRASHRLARTACFDMDDILNILIKNISMELGVEIESR